MKEKIKELLGIIESEIRQMSEEESIDTINNIRQSLSKLSPFRNEPVDCVIWLKANRVRANSYNPNSMAPLEQQLLYTSLLYEGYTQPIVVVQSSTGYTVVDGYHRMQHGKHKKELRKRLKGYLPTVTINSEECGEGECKAATVRHNRARGQHMVLAMSELVRDLARLGWKDERIAEELGMDSDEVLRLKQIIGLAELFDGDSYSEAWSVE